MTLNEANNGALSDIRVIEMGQLIAGPFCGQLLGDMGADVVKIEAPGEGDPMRGWGQGLPVTWEVIARNKKSLSLNLRGEEGQAIARRLIAQSDILIENFRPGTLERWNMAPEKLVVENPRLIVVRISGYGQSGPYSDRAGFGSVGEAMGGWRHLVGDPDRPPSRMGISIGDSLAATYGCLGALAALHNRHRTGRGQLVDCALYEAVLQVMEGLIPEYTVGNAIRGRSGSILPGVAPSNVYPCIDGDFLIAANQDSVFRRLCMAMGNPKIADDARFATHKARGENQIELDEIISVWTRTLSVTEIEALMARNGIPAGKIFKASDMLADPHFRARDAIIEVEHPRWRNLRMQNTFPRLSETPGSVRSIAPQTVGEHTKSILSTWLGVGENELADLRRRGVV
ncbi:MAG: CoA transferase [Rhizomicrobium sp.]